MFNFLNFYLSSFIPALFNCDVAFFAFCSVSFFGVVCLTMYLIRGKVRL